MMEATVGRPCSRALTTPALWNASCVRSIHASFFGFFVMSLRFHWSREASFWRRFSVVVVTMMREELPPVEARGQRVEAGRDVAAGSLGGRWKHRSILARAPRDRSLARKLYTGKVCIPGLTNQLII